MALFAHNGDAACAVAQRAEPGDVIGMNVSVDCLNKLKTKLIEKLDVAVDLVEHRIDDQRFPTATAGNQVRVGEGLAVE